MLSAGQQEASPNRMENTAGYRWHSRWVSGENVISKACKLGAFTFAGFGL